MFDRSVEIHSPLVHILMCVVMICSLDMCIYSLVVCVGIYTLLHLYI